MVGGMLFLCVSPFKKASQDRYLYIYYVLHRGQNLECVRIHRSRKNVSLVPKISWISYYYNFVFNNWNKICSIVSFWQMRLVVMNRDQGYHLSIYIVYTSIYVHICWLKSKKSVIQLSIYRKEKKTFCKQTAETSKIWFR